MLGLHWLWLQCGWTAWLCVSHKEGILTDTVGYQPSPPVPVSITDCKSSWKKNLFQPQLQLGDQMTYFMSMKYRQKPFGLVGSPQCATSWIKRESFLKRKPLAHCPLFFFFVNLVVRLRGAATIKRLWIDERGYENYYIKDGGVEKEKEPRSLITLLSFSISSG